MPDGKVEFDVELNRSKIPGEVAKVKRALSSLDGATPTITVKASTTAATNDLNAVKKVATELDGATPEITVKATDSASDVLDDVNRAADETDAKAPDIEATATDNASAKLKDVQNEADATGDKAPDVNVTVTDSATDVLEDVQATADTTGDKVPDINVTATDSATDELNDIQTEADETGGKDPTITVDADTSAAKSALDDLDGYIDGKTSKWDSVLSGIGMGLGQSILNGAKGVISSGLGAIFTGGMGFETGLAKVATMLPEGYDTATLGQSFLDLSTQYGVDVTDIEEAAYQALSAGVGIGENNQGLLSYLEQQMKVGVGGFTDTNSAVAAASAYLNTYGLDPSVPANQQRIANILLKTQNKGITTVGEQAGSISNATVSGAANNVSPEQIGAMVATMTAQMGQGKTAEATTATRQLINELSQSGTEAQKNLAAALNGTAYSGMTFKEAMSAGANMVDILSAMDTYAQKNDLSLSDMFSSVEAGNGALLLLNKSGQTFLDNLNYMEDDTDAVTYAYETMSDTTATAINKIDASMNEFAINLFTAMAPSLQKFLDVLTSDEFKAALQNLSDKFAEWMDSEGAATVIDSVTGAIQTLLDLLSGEKTIGDVLWSALESFFSKVGEFFGRMTISLVNAIIDAIPLLGTLGATHLDYDTVFGSNNLHNQNGGSEIVGTNELYLGSAPLYDRPLSDLKNENTEESSQNRIWAMIDNQVGDAAVVGQQNRRDTESEAEMREARRPYEGYVPLASGASGSPVTDLQKTLNDLGYALKEDGIFGKNTEEALRSFQKESGLQTTGTLTVETIVAIQKAQQDQINEAQKTVDTYNEQHSTPGAKPNQVTDEEYQAALQTLEAAGVTVEDSMNTLSESAVSIGEGLDSTTSSLLDAGISASQASTAGGKVKTALLALWRKLASITVPSRIGTGTSGNNGVPEFSKAVGLDAVPYDGYRAVLHQGEMVLNASEASAYRLSREVMALGGGSDIDYDRLASSMAQLGIYVDGRRLGNVTERGVSQRQYARAIARGRVNG